jgi:hypothetical protein
MKLPRLWSPNRFKRREREKGAAEVPPSIYVLCFVILFQSIVAERV